MKYFQPHQLLFLCLNVLAEFRFVFVLFSIQQFDVFVSVSSLLHLCHTLPAKKDLKKTVEFDIGFAIARIWSTASNSMNSLNTANLMEIYTVYKLFMSALCAKKVQTFTFVLMLWSFYTGGLKYYRVSHSKVNKVLLLWWGYKFWFLLIFWILHFHEIGPFMFQSSLFIELIICTI